MNEITAINDNELTYKLWTTGKDQAKAERDWVISEHQRLVILATVASTFVGESIAASEKKARVSKEYQDHIVKMGDLKMQVILCRSKYAAVDHEIKMRINKSFQQRSEFNSGKNIT